VRANGAIGSLVAILIASSSIADLGRLTLTDGTTLRGDISESETEVVLRNAAGELRYSREQVARIEYDAPASATQPASRPATRPAATHPKFEGPPPPPLLSKRDVVRLKLHEYPLDGEPQKITVEFLKKRGEPNVEELVARDIRAGIEFEDLRWNETLKKGQPPEKLQLILKATGVKYADRIEIRGDTETFAPFRRRVLSQLTTGCAKSGCHGGNVAHVWRLPAGIQAGEEYAYTSFYIVNSLQTPLGPMIDRNLPEQSALLKYMLPAKGESAAHPPVKNVKIAPVFSGTNDPDYQAVLSWINSLRVHARYELDYEPPEWLRKLSEPVRKNGADDAPSTQPVRP